jgi:Na+/melibiose symporter-like transporter
MSETTHPAAGRIWTCGTLRYSAFGLAALFFWLLWGDFIWVLLDQSVPGILPFKLKDMGASDTMNQVLNRSLACAVVFLLAPAISMASDRHRGRWGRRIPYLLWSTPFVGLFLVLIGNYEFLTGLVVGQAQTVSVFGWDVGRAGVTLFIFGAALVAYDISNVFVNSIYYYLFNDVVPEGLLARFLAMFRMVGVAGSAIYSKFIFPHVLDNFRLVFTIAGIGYVVGFLLMCLFVKEGSYPPPPVDDKRPGLLAMARTFARQCFTHRFYWYFFLTSTFLFMSWQAGSFGSLRNRDSLHLDMRQLGDLGFWCSTVSFCIMLPAAWLADRFHPVRVYVVLTIVQFLNPLAQCVWIFHDFGPHGNLVGQYILAIVALPIAAVQGAAELPMYMRVLPRDRYGQFCSANAMIRAFALMFGAALAGIMMDVLKNRFGMDEWRYRYYAAWTVFWQIPALVCLILLYREWKRLGGDKDYKPPAT